MEKSFSPADLQPLQRLAYAALTASEPFRTLMLICVGMLFRITDEMVGVNLGRGLVPSPAWFKPLRPAAHALNEQAKAFYLGHGFIESPIEPMTLMLSLAQTAA
jgi:hypothetical protein